jgi:hypothetical protein
VEGVGADVSGNYTPATTVFVSVKTPLFYWLSESDLDIGRPWHPAHGPEGVFALLSSACMGI